MSVFRQAALSKTALNSARNRKTLPETPQNRRGFAISRLSSTGPACHNGQVRQPASDSPAKTPAPPRDRGLAFSGAPTGGAAPARRLLLFGLRTLAAALFVVYLLWNGFWLVQGQLAPSLFLALTGLPAPSTGMTRSLRSLLHGDLPQSLAWNALTVPALLLFVLSVAWPLLQLSRRQRPGLPPWVCRSWILLFSAAWLIKLLGNRQYW